MQPVETIWRFKDDEELKVFLASIYNIPFCQFNQIKFAMYEHFGNRQAIEQPKTVLGKSTWHHLKDKMNTKRRLVFFIERKVDHCLVEVENIDGDPRKSQWCDTNQLLDPYKKGAIAGDGH